LAPWRQPGQTWRGADRLSIGQLPIRRAETDIKATPCPKRRPPPERTGSSAPQPAFSFVNRMLSLPKRTKSSGAEPPSVCDGLATRQK